MKITRILSNNAVMLVTPNEEEFVAVGRGVGFGKKPGDVAEQHLIENLFGKKNEGLGAYFATILGEIPAPTLQAVESVIRMAELSLKISAPETLFLALSDHINAAITRMEKGKPIHNGLMWEIRTFYPEEFSVALQAIEMLNRRLHFKLPDDEAGFIALHLANAVNDGSLQQHVKSAEILHDLINIVRYEMPGCYDEKNEVTQRFIVHLRFFIQRMLNKNQHEVGVPELYDGLPQMIPDAYKSTLRLGQYIEKTHHYTLNKDEFAFLALHLHRLKSSQDIEE